MISLNLVYISHLLGGDQNASPPPAAPPRERISGGIASVSFPKVLNDLTLHPSETLQAACNSRAPGDQSLRLYRSFLLYVGVIFSVSFSFQCSISFFSGWEYPNSRCLSSSCSIWMLRQLWRGKKVENSNLSLLFTDSIAVLMYFR